MSRKLLKFLILFDNPSLLYLPGQFLTGRVLVELEDDTPFSGLFFTVVGEGVVKLKTRNRNQERLYDKESYIDFRMRLLGGQGPILLSPGIHSFPFKLGLPLGLPSTFLGKHGYVQFYCKAALREPNGLVHKNQQIFIVLNPIDLNLEPPVLAKPFHCEIEHKLGMNCVNSTGNVFCRVRLDKGGYVPGELIHIWASIKNGSRTAIKSTQAILTETIQYLAREKIVATEKRELVSFSKGKIKPGHSDDWIDETLLIPPLPPTNIKTKLIRIQYDVFFVIHPSSFDKKIKLQLPILMATYPLRNDNGTLSKENKYPTILPLSRE